MNAEHGRPRITVANMKTANTAFEGVARHLATAIAELGDTVQTAVVVLRDSHLPEGVGVRLSFDFSEGPSAVQAGVERIQFDAEGRVVGESPLE